MKSLQVNPTDERLPAVNRVLVSLVASLKNFGLYTENHDICLKSIGNTFRQLESFFERDDTLRLDIAKDRILYQNDIVFKDSANENQIAFFLFRDGIKWVEFRQGLTIDELSVFLKILNKYRILRDDPEGDMATALWEANLQNLNYKATDIFWDADPVLDLQLPSPEKPTRFPADASDQDPKSTLIQDLQNQEDSLVQLTVEETAALQAMIREEENRDSTQDLLYLASILLKDKANLDLLAALFQFVKTETHAGLDRGEFDTVYKTLKSLYSIRANALAQHSWAVPHFNKLIKEISDPKFLSAFAHLIRKLDQADPGRLKLIWHFFLMLHPIALEALAPMMSQIRSLAVQKQFIKVLAKMASRDLKILESVLGGENEQVLQSLVQIAAAIPGEKSIPILRKMTHHPSARVRKQSVKGLLARDPSALESLFSLIEDPNDGVRQAIFDHLQHHKNEIGEKLLLEYLGERQFGRKDPDHILACYKLLGKCGSAESIPFLKQILFKRMWRNVFQGHLHRQGAVAALITLEGQESQAILSKAARSFSPAVRMAYKRGAEAIHC